MIPKKIHYIWFGGKPLSKVSNICINSWKEKLPEYEIIEWNEKNLDLDQLCRENKFFAECRKRKLYAYMADYLRLRILYEQGGIYMDTDMQVLKSFDKLTDTNFLIGHASYEKIGTGFIGAEKGCPVTKRILDFYNEEIWHSELFTIPDIVGYLFEKEKFDVKVYDKEYFSPCAFDKPFSEDDITENTYMIHWYEGSWTLNKQVVLFLMTKHISNPVQKRMIITKKWIGFYLRKIGLLK